jgi:hypothetical protein
MPDSDEGTQGTHLSRQPEVEVSAMQESENAEAGEAEAAVTL